jgi:hypothetical protein
LLQRVNMKHRNLVLFTLLTMTSACDADSSRAQLRFAEAPESVRHAAITASLGYPLLLGEVTSKSLMVASALPVGCPERRDQPDGIWLDTGGGCTGLSGVRYYGRVHLGNDPAWPLKLWYDGFRADGGDAVLGLSGALERSASDASGVYTTVEDVRFDLGTPVQVQITATCVSGTCVADGGAIGEVPTHGSYEIAFARRVEAGVWSGWVELRGEDVLRLDLSQPRDADGCWAYTIGGRPAGRWCGATSAP